MNSVMRGHVGELVFFFEDDHATGLDLYRDWVKTEGAQPLKPGEVLLYIRMQVSDHVRNFPDASKKDVCPACGFTGDLLDMKHDRCPVGPVYWPKGVPIPHSFMCDECGMTHNGWRRKCPGKEETR